MVRGTYGWFREHAVELSVDDSVRRSLRFTNLWSVVDLISSIAVPTAFSTVFSAPVCKIWHPDLIKKENGRKLEKLGGSRDWPGQQDPTLSTSPFRMARPHHQLVGHSNQAAAVLCEAARVAL